MTSRSLMVSSAALVAAILFLAAVQPSHAATIFQEDFNGYTVFDNSSDPVNLGVPLISEGADEGEWMGARVGTDGVGSITDDIGVQRVYFNLVTENMTPAGRFSDDAGLAVRLDLTAYENVQLEFDWRMFKADNLDRKKFAYYVGDGLGTPNNIVDWSGIYGSFTEVLSRGRMLIPNSTVNGASQHEIVSLPGGNVIYLVWWLDNHPATGSGDADHGKLDNVMITGDLVVPEPASVVFVVLGVASALVGLRRRRG